MAGTSYEAPHYVAFSGKVVGNLGTLS